MSRLNILLAGCVGLVVLAWLAGSPEPVAADAAWPWLLRDRALTLTGVLALVLLSLAMVLATRPAWLEGPLGGLDRTYRAHRWAGTGAGAVAVAHWLVEMSDDPIAAFAGRAGRVSREHGAGLLEAAREFAGDLGEWSIYALLAMLALALYRRFPFDPWRLLHRAMPVLYLAIALHGALLLPSSLWREPLGALLGLALAGGTVSAALALSGRIGRRRQFRGSIERVTHPAPDVTEISCRLDAGWPGHAAGQFAFVALDGDDAGHPFTIASAAGPERRVRFAIKARGAHTRALASRARAGAAVRVEGPYGRFDRRRARARAAQAWVAAGIGVTPFLAWLEALAANPADAPAADFHYCVRDRDRDPFVPRVERACAALPAIRLQVHSSDRDPPLDAAALAAARPRARALDVWFCGPKAFGQALRGGLRAAGTPGLRFHQEAFELR